MELDNNSSIIQNFMTSVSLQLSATQGPLQLFVLPISQLVAWYLSLLLLVTSASHNYGLSLTHSATPLSLLVSRSLCQLLSVSGQKARANTRLNLCVFLLSKFIILWFLCPIPRTFALPMMSCCLWPSQASATLSRNSYLQV